MKITRKEVDYVARLAKLELNELEKEKLIGEMEKTLDYIDQLNILDTENVVPTSHVLPLTNVWREDELKQSSDEVIDRILANAPEREDNFYKVRKVID